MNSLIATRPRLTAPKRARLLELIRAEPDVGTATACLRVGVKGSKGAIREMVLADEELQAELAEARGRGPEQVRAEIRRRAIDGVDEPVFHNGEVCGQVRRYSDRLLALMAKANLPEYRDTARVEVTGADGGPVSVEKREVSLHGVLHILAAAGALDDVDLGALAGARPVLPARPE
jgi:hypothetical protein